MSFLDIISHPILLSMSPFSELRGGVISAILYHQWNPLTALIICLLANLIVIIPIWFFLDYIHGNLLGIMAYKRFSDKILERMRHKATHVKKKMEKYKWLALTLFVAIPLPITGAYTGSLVVWILGLNRKKSFLFISLGVLIAAIIMTLVTVGGINLFYFAS